GGAVVNPGRRRRERAGHVLRRDVGRGGQLSRGEHVVAGVAAAEREACAGDGPAGSHVLVREGCGAAAQAHVVAEEGAGGDRATRDRRGRVAVVDLARGREAAAHLTRGDIGRCRGGRR